MSYFAISDELPAWVGDLPDDWKHDWMKWSVQLSTERPTEEEQALLPYISNEDIASWTGKLLNDQPQPAESDGRNFQVDDVLLNKLRPYLAKVYHADFDGVSSGELLCLRSSSIVFPRFLFYVLVSKGFIDSIDAETFGTKMPRADWEIVGHQPLPLPSLETQRHIAQFLDEKTARIDGLIEKKRALLTRLAEKRQALITRAVTGGIDDSTLVSAGTDSLKGCAGMIDVMLPAGWASKRLKYLATYNDEVLLESTDEETEIDYVEISGVSLSGGVEQVDRIPFGRAPSRARRKVRNGDILISTVRTYLRAIAKVDKASPDFVASTGFCVVRPKREEVDSGYLGWAAKSEPFVSEIVSRSVGVSYPAINASELVTIEMPLPSFGDQRRIAQFLNEKTANIDKQTEKIEKSISLLNEYRSALITAAVTGQIEGLQ